MSTVSDPKYDSDLVNLGYLNKIIKNLSSETTEEIQEYSKNYTKTPFPPYFKNDTWVNQNKLYICIKSREIGSFTLSDWKLVVNGEALDNFIKNIYSIDKIDLQDQIDNKIESYIQDEDPSLSWETNIVKEQHKGDFWRRKISDEYHEYVYTKYNTNPITYGWEENDVPQAVFDLIDSKKTIYTSKPTSYNKNDLWIIESSVLPEDIPLNCNIGDWVVSLNNSLSYNKIDWEKRDKNVNLDYLQEHYYDTTTVSAAFEELDNSIDSKIFQTKEDINANITANYATKETTNSIIQDISDITEEVGTLSQTTASNTESITNLSLSNQEMNLLIEENKTTINDTKVNLSENYTNNNQLEEKFNNYDESFNQRLINVKTTLEGTVQKMSETGGNNLWRNTYFSEFENGLLTFWNGQIKSIPNFNSISRTAGSLQNGSVSQTVILKNGKYTNSFKYIKKLETATAYVKYNNKIFPFSEANGIITSTEDITTDSMTIEFFCDTNDGFQIYDLMLNVGTSAMMFTQNANETITDTVNIGKGVEVKNSAIKSKCGMYADGLRGVNTDTGEITFYQTTDGLYGKKFKTETMQSGDLIITTRNRHNFISGL